MLFTEFASLVGGQVLQLGEDHPLDAIVTDSRKPVITRGSVFFAIHGSRHDGHGYLGELFSLGLRHFVVEHPVRISELTGASVLQVPSSLAALQTLAAHHRKQFNIPIVGITGSNGKTTIKEWLYQVLAPGLHVLKSPGSYNSQLGVPLSVWELNDSYDLAIFEAGISTVHEMEKLSDIIRPTLGIFTNLGSAHNEGFTSLAEKADEKAKLFTHCEATVCCADHPMIVESLSKRSIKTFTWGLSATADVRIESIQKRRARLRFRDQYLEFTLPFDEPVMRENVFHVIAFMLLRSYASQTIQDRINGLQSVPMRLELKQGIHRSTLIDDTYNNDLAGLKMSIDFLRNQQKARRVIILSDILQSGLLPEELIGKIRGLVSVDAVTEFIGIGPVLYAQRDAFPGGTFYQSTNEFLQHLDTTKFTDAVVLIKGARPFQFERIAERLQRKVHGTVMEVDLTAMVHNLNYFKSCLKPSTKIMAMVKAFAYGSGSEEVANILQYHRVDYLGVAFADEGVELRKNNIRMPIMVMNPTEESFPWMIEYQLEPEIYSEKIFSSLLGFLRGRPCTIHLKIDTGMHRLGFEEQDMETLTKLLRQNKDIHVASVFTHLAGADDPHHDEFSAQQVNRFTKMADLLDQLLGYRPLRHVLNSPGVLRLSQYQFDMIRVGIGLYGIDPTVTGNDNLKPVLTLKTIISQIKNIKAGETVGYGRKGKTDKDITLATLAIGYADGFSRRFSNGAGNVLINGQLAPVKGNVCMDMTMVDISGISAQEGDEAIVFGPGLPIQQVAQWIETIPYEILTSTSERVKRVFLAESV